MTWVRREAPASSSVTLAEVVAEEEGPSNLSDCETPVLGTTLPADERGRCARRNPCLLPNARGL
jgi:hypothetical protein